MKASRTSSRGRLHGNTVPAGRYVGTSCAYPGKRACGPATGKDACRACHCAADSRTGGHLHGVHSYVYTALQQRIIYLFGEQAFAANIRQRLVENLVAGCFDDTDLQGAFLLQLWKGCLQNTPFTS